MSMKDDDALPTSKSLSQLRISNQGDGLVVQSNKLIDAAYKLSLEEMRLLYIALKKINPKMEIGSDGLVPEIVISVSEYREAFGIKTHALHDRLSETANSLLSKPLTTFDWNEEKQKMDKTKRVWFTSIAYDAEGDVSSIKLRFFTRAASIYL
jgi:Initiator Replication protein.